MDKNCTIYKTVDFIGKRWTLLILLEIYRGNSRKRYSELKKNLPEITPKVLSARLKELVRQELVKKEIDSSEVPIKSFYYLTSSGKDFINIIKSIKKWALKWKINNNLCKNTFCRNCSIKGLS